MTNKSSKALFTVYVLAFVLALSIYPSLTHGATYAYVATTGELKTIEASNWQTAIDTALDIHIQSGVFLMK